MTRLALALALLLAACGPKGTGAREPEGNGPDEDIVKSGEWDPKLIEALLGQVHDELGCPNAKKHRIWCIPADGWAGGKAGELPSKPTLLVGLTLGFAEGDKAEDWMEEGGVHFSALGLRTADGVVLARIAPLAPSTRDEALLLQPAIEGVAAVFKAEADVVELPADLADYLKDLPDAASYPLEKTEHGWRYKGVSATELRQVGAFWIAIEIPPEGPRGLLVSIFTDRIK